MSLDYSLFTEQCERFGYTYEPYVVVTDDLWHLTVFHITGYIDDAAAEAKREALTDGKMPVLSISGSFGDA